MEIRSSIEDNRIECSGIVDNGRVLVIYATVLCIIANSACMWEYTTSSVFFGVKLGLILVLFCTLQILINSELAFCRSTIITFTTLLAALLVYVVITRYNLSHYLLTYVGLFVIFFWYVNSLYSCGRVKQFFTCYANVMLIIALLSLFFWFFGSLLGILPGKTSLTYDWSEKGMQTYTWFNLYYENPVQNIDQPIPRNLGLFVEAPGYSGQLIYALLVEICLWKDENSRGISNARLFRIFVFSVTIFTTLSTKGILACMLIFLLLLFTMKSNSLMITLAKWVLGCGATIVVVFAAYYILAQKMMTGSGMFRMDDLIATIRTWKDSPIFGAGYENFDAVWRHASIYRESGGGLSMGLTTLLAWGGLWLFSIYSIAVYLSRRITFFSQNKRIWYLVILILLYNLFVSNFAFTNAYVFMLAASYSLWDKHGNPLQTEGLYSTMKIE